MSAKILPFAAGKQRIIARRSIDRVRQMLEVAGIEDPELPDDLIDAIERAGREGMSLRIPYAPPLTEESFMDSLHSQMHLHYVEVFPNGEVRFEHR